MLTLLTVPGWTGLVVVAPVVLTVALAGSGWESSVVGGQVLELMKPLGLTDVSRTGVAAISRGKFIDPVDLEG